uniref:Putative transcriptional regulator n=1 Tax=Acetobacter pasteurianus TaxID=438 RepID=I3W085_ACEPA|nr:addiction module antidote protein [Acetobacter pasteurianus]AFK89012.1 putative transcriptional regulator [Acetobacter pasteurianus]
MTKHKLIPFDAVAAAANPDVQAELLNMAWEDGDNAGIAHALAVIAKAQGMTETARRAGITRPALYKALSETGNPNLSSLIGIMKALGVKVSFQMAPNNAG